MVQENCWDFWQCPEKTKKQCQVFKLNMGDECWFIQNSKGVSCAKAKAADVNDCLDCPFFKKYNS